MPKFLDYLQNQQKKNKMAGTIAAEVSAASGIMSASSVFYFLLVPAIALWFVYWKLSRRHMHELASKIPGPDGLPIIGNLLDLAGTSHSKYYNYFFFLGVLVYNKIYK